VVLWKWTVLITRAQVPDGAAPSNEQALDHGNAMTHQTLNNETEGRKGLLQMHQAGLRRSDWNEPVTALSGSHALPAEA
jgi:hypothetical protein